MLNPEVFELAELEMYAALKCQNGLVQMWSKDQKPQPKKGRAFPYRFGDAVRLVNSLKLTKYDGKRIAVRFENNEGEYFYGTPLLDYVPEEEVAIYSLIETQCTNKITRAVERSLTALSKYETKPKDSLHDSYFCAYLTEEQSIRLTRIDRTAKLKKYRGNDKLSNARYVGSNAKELELELIPLK